MRKSVKVIAIAALASLSLGAFAAGVDKSIPIKNNVPFKTGGEIAALSNILVPEMNKRGWNITSTFHGSCAAAVAAANESKDPSITITDGAFLVGAKGTPCYIEKPEDKLVNIIYTAPWYLCKVGPEAGTDFFDNKDEPKIGVHVDFPKPMLRKIMKKTSSMVTQIAYRNSAGIAAAAAAKEVDYIFINSGLKLQANNLVTCQYNSTNQEVYGTKPFEKRIDTPFNAPLVMPMLQFNMNPETLAEFQKDLRESMKSEAYLAFMATAKYSLDPVKLDDAEQKKMLLQILEGFR